MASASSNGHHRTGGAVGDDIMFEAGRINVLKEERQYIQKKTFTKWVNSYLNKVNMHVNDLFVDLADGKALLKLLEIISGEKIGKPSNGKMRVHKVENLNKSLAFLHTKVRLESIGAEDIVDGNPTLILGLIWTIILRFLVDIKIPADDEPEAPQRSGKEALLLWTQQKTRGYQGVKVDNFTNSWKNGLAFNALIHAHYPELVDFDSLSADRPLENLKNAFDVAEKHLGLSRLLDPEDILERPDEKSVITYVSTYYHKFAGLKTGQIAQKRINKIVGSLLEIDRLKTTYERLCSDLIKWLIRKTQELKDRSFPNRKDGLQKDFARFKEYRSKEKPPRMMERGNIEVAFFEIQTKSKDLGQKAYIPPEGYTIQLVDQHWKQLEVAEHQREMALREAMMRLERLERLADKFKKKAELRSAWLKEMTTLLTNQKVGKTIPQIDATLKKFEAIKADIQPREERFAELMAMSDELTKEDYYDKETIKHRADDILQKWKALLELLQRRRLVLDKLGSLVDMIRDADSLYADLKHLEAQLRSTDNGQNLETVQALLQKHALMEAELLKMGNLLNDLNVEAPRVMKEAGEEGELLTHSLTRVNDQYKVVQGLAQNRGKKLSEVSVFFLFEGDAEEEDSWAMEKLRALESLPIPRDSRQAEMYQQKAKVMETELSARYSKVQSLQATGESLVSKGHPFKNRIQNRLASLTEHWTNLRSLLKDFLQSMDASLEYFHYHSDANEIESWLKEALTILTGLDTAADVNDVEPLIRRHHNLEEEISAFEPDVKRLGEQSQNLQRYGAIFKKISEAARTIVSPDRELARSVSTTEQIEEQKIPQVVVMYPFNVGELTDVKKGEVMTLVDKPEDDWWFVRREDGVVGAAPANHLKEIEPRVIRKKTTVVEKTKSGVSVQRTPSMHFPKEVPVQLDAKHVAERYSAISKSYVQLKNEAAERRKLLGEAAGVREFLRECDELKHWISEQTFSVLADNSEEPASHQQKRFDKFRPEFGARKKQFAELQKTGADLIARKHRSSRDAKNALDELTGLWYHLEELRQAKEKDLEYRNGMEQYSETVKNATEYITQKSVSLKIEVPAKGDISAMRNLHKKIANSERELVPIQQVIETVRSRGEPLKTKYPQEEPFIMAKEKELQSLSQKLQDYLTAKRSELEGDVSQSLFESALDDLMEWCHATMAVLDEQPFIPDRKAAGELRQLHSAVYDDIRAHDPEFDTVEELGKESLKANLAFEPEAKQIFQKLKALREEMHRKANEKTKALEYAETLLEASRKVNRALDEIHRLENILNEQPEAGSSHAEVETLLRRHEDLHADLNATAQRNAKVLEAGLSLVNSPPNNHNLIHKPHDKLSSQLIQLQEALGRFADLHGQAEKRKAMLEDSLAFQSWKTDVDEIDHWMEGLLPMMSAEPSEEELSSEKGYRKHAKQVAEINANTERIQELSSDGKAMIVAKHFASPTIATSMEQMLMSWTDLTNRAELRNQKFEQAAKARGFYGNVDKAKSRLTQIQLMLEQKDGMDENADPRKLRNELKNAESNIKHAEEMVELVRNDAKFLAANNHFNGPKLLQKAKELQIQLNRLQDPAKRRWAELDEIVKKNQIVGDLEREHFWIEERLEILSRPNVGKTSNETASLLAKLDGVQGEVQAHEPALQRVLFDGLELSTNYPDSVSYANLCKEVKQKWQELVSRLPVRRTELELAEKGHRYWLDYTDSREWVDHHLHHLKENPAGGKDIESAGRLIEQNAQLTRELKSEKELLDDMEDQATFLVQKRHPEGKDIAEAQKSLRQQMNELEQLLNERGQQLGNSKLVFAFQDDCNDLEMWLQDQIRVAENADYGVDAATLAVTTADFANFDKKVTEKGPRKIKLLETEAEEVVKNGAASPEDVATMVARIHMRWADLKASIERREVTLDKMEDVFAFNDKVDECRGSIQDALAMCHDHEGGELKDVLIRMKRHAEVENDAKRIQLEIDQLKEDSMDLIERYPGKDAENVSRKRASLVEDWDGLKKALVRRRNELESLATTHRWLNNAKELQKWGDHSLANMTGDHPESVSIDVQVQDHSDMRAEIVAKYPEFEQLLTALPSALPEQVAEKTQALQSLKQRLPAAWEDRKALLDETYHVRKFLRDLDQIDATSVVQAAYLDTKEPSDLTGDQISKLISNHSAFEKVVAQQAEKLKNLENQAEFLVQEHKIDARQVTPKLQEVSVRRKRIGDMSARRTQHLQDMLAYSEFVGIAEDLEAWMEEKATLLKSTPADELGFEEKLKEYLKHHTFEAEVKNFTERAQTMVQKGHTKSQAIKARTENINEEWTVLREALQTRREALLGAKLINAFIRDCEEAISWLHGQETIAYDEDLGQDSESVQALIHRHEKFQRDLAPFGQRIQHVEQESTKLLHTYHASHARIEKKRDEVLLMWSQLVTRTEVRTTRLAVSNRLQNYLDKYNEFSDWISATLAAITANDLPQEVHRAEAVIARHKKYEMEIAGRREEFLAVCKEGRLIVTECQSMAGGVAEKVRSLEEGYATLTEVWKRRNELYALNLDIQIFIRDCNLFTSWMNSQEPILHDEDLGDSIQRVEELIRKHDDFQKNVENQDERLALVKRLTELEKLFNLQAVREQQALEADKQRQALSANRVAHSSSVTTVPFIAPIRGEFSAIEVVDSRTTPTKLHATLSADKTPPVDMESELERKQELDAGGSKHSQRSWKSYHTVLIGQLLCFYKKKMPSYEYGKHSASTPLNLYRSEIGPAFDYKKKDYVFRIRLEDKSEYLFAAETDEMMDEWIKRITFHAALPPHQQLTIYEQGQQMPKDGMNGHNGTHTTEHLEESEDSAQYSRALPRAASSPISNGNSEHVAPVPRPRPRNSQMSMSPERGSYPERHVFSLSSEVLSEGNSDSEPVVVVQKRSSMIYTSRNTGKRSESFGGEIEDHSERGVDVDYMDRPRTTSSLAMQESRGNGRSGAYRGATLPSASSFGQHSPDGPTSSLDGKKSLSDKKSGSRISIPNIFKRKEKEKA